MRTLTTLGALTLLVWGHATAQPGPQILNYQGKLVKSNGAAYPNGTVQVRVKVTSAPNGGNVLWDSGQRSVTVQSGVFSIALSGGSPVFSGQVFQQGLTWFEVSVVDAQSVERVLSPRQAVASVPWCFWAETVSDGAITSAKLAYDPASFLKMSGGNVNYDPVTTTLSSPHLLAGNIKLDNGANTASFIDMMDGYGGAVRLKTDGLAQLAIESARTRFDGFLGINSATQPTTALDVQGDTTMRGALLFPAGSGGSMRITSNDITFVDNTGSDVTLQAVTTNGVGNGTLTVATNKNGLQLGAVKLYKLLYYEQEHISSRRFKSKIKWMEPVLPGILKLQPVTFTYNGQSSRKPGLIAESVAEVFPLVVGLEADGKTARGLDYDGLCSILIKGLQEEDARVKSLEGKNRDLSSRLDRVTAELADLRQQIAGLGARR